MNSSNKAGAVSLAFFLLALGLVASAQNPKASIREETISMLTYGFSDPDPVANPYHQQYPYFRFDGYESTGSEKQWKAVILENDWIEVTIFPEIGGKIWGALDKTTGKEFVYHNHVVKFRDIAMRGPWTSGGIEFNFGLIGHAPTTATPVDYAIRDNSDGSVSCFVASLELLTRTWWSVEIRLPADKACFTTNVEYLNLSPLEQPYYNWMNAAFKAAEDLQICYPGDRYIGHDGDSHPYPFDAKGRNLSWYRNNAFEGAKSYHVIGEYDNFFGAWWHDQDFGFAHVARPDEKLGRKIFQWSHARDGIIWEDLLTDSDGQYVEMQSGRMFNQPMQFSSINTPFKHHSFAPGGRDSWSEYWFPVEKIGAFQAASSFGALSFTRLEEGRGLLKVSPTTAGRRLVRISDIGFDFFSEVVDFSPLEPWQMEVSGLTDQFVKISIGQDELVYNEDPSSRKTNRPDTMSEDFDRNTAYGHCLRGEQLLNVRMFALAREEFEASLSIEPGFAPALLGMADLCLHSGLDEEAFLKARKALQINTYDGKANYLYALAARRTGRITEAKDGFALATYTDAYRNAAYAALAKIAILEREWNLAATYTHKIGSSAEKGLLHAVMYRHLGATDAAFLPLEMESARIPLFPFHAFEASLLSGKDDFKSSLRCELPHETLIEMALWYLDCGLYDEAAKLCSMTEYPSARYLEAFIAHMAGDSDKADSLLVAANATPPDFVFPFRAEMLEVFRWAQDRKPDWKTRYYMGLIHWNHGLTGEARELLESCEGVDYAPFYLSRALLASGDDRLADLQRAESLQKSWRGGDALVRHHMEESRWDKACKAGQEYFKSFPDKFELGLDYAEALCGAGEYSKALGVLSKLRVMPKEGAYKGHAIYRRACLGKAKEELRAGKFAACIKSVEASKVWDERLGVGMPYEDQIDYCEENAIIRAAKEKNRHAFDNDK